MARALGWAAATTIVVLLGIQAIPYGRARTNPAKSREPPWDSPRTRALASRACFDCHSNETVWPWYSNVAPISWLVQRDVDEGREELNFSEWDRPQEEAAEAAEAVRTGKMPPWYYPWGRLARADRDHLARGLAATLGGGGGAADRE